MNLEKKSVAELREMAKKMGVTGLSSLRKSQLICRIEERTSEDKQTEPVAPAEPNKQVEQPEPNEPNGSTEKKTGNSGKAAGNNRRDARKSGKTGKFEKREKNAGFENKNRNTKPSYSGEKVAIAKERYVTEIPVEEAARQDSGIVKTGILDIQQGFGFVRCDNYLSGANDVYVAGPLIRYHHLRTGDMVTGHLKKADKNEKFSAMLYIEEVNGRPVKEIEHRKKFEELTPIFPNQRIRLETERASVSTRMIDLIAPIGKGQRGMIVSQPKTGKTTLLKQVAQAVKLNEPNIHIIILLIDERPEEVTDIKETVEGKNVEVIYSTFDEEPNHHIRVSEMVLERAKRLVESGDDVLVLLDSITRLARAYNLTGTQSGKTLSGGLDPAALHMPKKFFGAARNMREGGSLTILATALVDTGSRMDDVVFEEFKGTGNMELVLDRNLSEKRVFPAIDIQKSSTRREDLLLNSEEMEAVYIMRRAMGVSIGAESNMEQLIELFQRTKNNKDFMGTLKNLNLF